jgi:hypothetical protein
MQLLLVVVLFMHSLVAMDLEQKNKTYIYASGNARVICGTVQARNFSMGSDMDDLFNIETKPAGEKVEYEYKNVVNGALTVENAFGVIKLITTEKPIIKIKAETTERLKNALKVISVMQTNNTIQINSLHDRGYEINYEILVPKDSKVFARNVSGDIDFESKAIRNSIELRTARGSISLVCGNLDPEHNKQDKGRGETFQGTAQDGKYDVSLQTEQGIITISDAIK